MTVHGRSLITKIQAYQYGAPSAEYEIWGLLSSIEFDVRWASESLDSSSVGTFHFFAIFQFFRHHRCTIFLETIWRLCLMEASDSDRRWRLSRQTYDNWVNTQYRRWIITFRILRFWYSRKTRIWYLLLMTRMLWKFSCLRKLNC